MSGCGDRCGRSVSRELSAHLYSQNLNTCVGYSMVGGECVSLLHACLPYCGCMHSGCVIRYPTAFDLLDWPYCDSCINCFD